MISGTEKVILYLDGLTLAGSLTLMSSWSRVATSTCASCHVLLAEWCTRHVHVPRSAGDSAVIEIEQFLALDIIILLQLHMIIKSCLVQEAPTC